MNELKYGLFILWQPEQKSIDIVRNYLSRQFSIVFSKPCKLQSREKNTFLMRFYCENLWALAHSEEQNIHLDLSSHRLKLDTNFYLFIIEDACPVPSIETSLSGESFYLNKNIYSAKKFLRKILGGPNFVHGSNGDQEFRLQYYIISEYFDQLVL